MSREFIDRCNMCGKVKGEANHWFLYSESELGAYLMAWDEVEAPDAKMLCGQSCAIKIFSLWMGGTPEVIPA